MNLLCKCLVDFFFFIFLTYLFQYLMIALRTENWPLIRRTNVRIFLSRLKVGSSTRSPSVTSRGMACVFNKYGKICFMESYLNSESLKVSQAPVFYQYCLSFLPLNYLWEFSVHAKCQTESLAPEVVCASLSPLPRHSCTH